MKKTIINILFCLIVIGLAVILYKYITEKTEEKYSVSGIISAAENSDEISGSGTDYVASSDLSPVTLFVGINPASASVTGICLEILRCSAHSSLTYINIPPDSRFTMSEELYRRLSAMLPQMPQIATLSETFHYFGLTSVETDSNGTDGNGTDSNVTDSNVTDTSGTDSAMTALTLMLSELSGTKINSYVLLPSDTFNSIFTSSAKAGVSSLLSESDSHLGLFREIWSDAVTNTLLEDRLVYLDTFDALRSSDITVLSAEGERTNSSFVIDKNSLTLRVYNAMNK